MLTIYRLAAWLNRRRVPCLPTFLYVVNRILFSVVLPPTTRVGPRTVFAYQGLAVVVHGRAVIGSDCYVGPHVIVGGRSGHPAVLVIGDRVLVGPGRRALGPIEIGNDAKMDAGAVVLGNVAPGQTVVGNPARPLPRVVSTGSVGCGSSADADQLSA